MDKDAERDVTRDLERAREAFFQENTVAALAHFEKVLKIDDNPLWYSYLGYCIAKERGQFRKGEELCRISLEREPQNAVHYLNLGRLHLAAGKKEEALQTFRDGMSREGNDEILRTLVVLGMRKPPIFPSLPRSNPLNKYLGLILHRLGLR